jgi:hypothetical protein
MTRTAATASVVILNTLRNRLDLTLLTISSSKFKAAHLKRAQTISKLDYVNKAVEIVGGEH